MGRTEIKQRSGTVPIAVAAEVLGMDKQTLRMLLQEKLVDFGIAFKKPGSSQHSYLIFAVPFYNLTGYRADTKQSIEIIGEKEKGACEK